MAPAKPNWMKPVMKQAAGHEMPHEWIG